MPELPEVETMVRLLRPALRRRRVANVLWTDPFLFKNVEPRQYRSRIRGTTVADVRRSGKWLILRHTGGLYTLIQPRMTGGFQVGGDKPPERWKVAWVLDRPPLRVWYYDLRRLGVILLLGRGDLRRLLEERHGPDALVITAEELHERLAHTDRAIKVALMDQKLVAGLGNIYAEEALHRAGIRPDRPANTLTIGECRRLVRAIRQVLKLAIRHAGTTIRDYRQGTGEPGGFQRLLMVYGREGEPCYRCGTPIRRIRLRGLLNRSTHFCPACQS